MDKCLPDACFYPAYTANYSLLCLIRIQHNLIPFLLAYIKKKIPRDIRKLRDRLKRFEYIFENYDMNVTAGLLDEGQNHLGKVRETVDRYNEVLHKADILRKQLDEQVHTGRDIHERLRAKVISAFGRDSIEYEQLGGTRPSDIDYSRKNRSEE